MSWKRILQTARRLGAPVIVTDERGHEPLIIMPLDAYESPTGAGRPAPIFQPPTRSVKFSGPDDRTAGAFEAMAEFDLPGLDLPLDGEKIKESVVEEEARTSVRAADETAEIPLEDRFYFEPVDDEFKK